MGEMLYLLLCLSASLTCLLLYIQECPDWELAELAGPVQNTGLFQFHTSPLVARITEDVIIIFI